MPFGTIHDRTRSRTKTPLTSPESISGLRVPRRGAQGGVGLPATGSSNWCTFYCETGLLHTVDVVVIRQAHVVPIGLHEGGVVASQRRAGASRRARRWPPAGLGDPAEPPGCYPVAAPMPLGTPSAGPLPPPPSMLGLGSGCPLVPPPLILDRQAAQVPL